MDLHIEEAPVERQEALRRLRELCLKELTGFEETMDYGGPSYKRNGELEVGFTSQKHFASGQSTLELSGYDIIPL